MFFTNKRNFRDFFPQYTEENNEDVMVGHCYATLISKGSSDTWYIAACDGKYDDRT